MSPKIPVKAVCLFTASGSRPVQEDVVFSHQEKGIFAVADGFGGGAAGFQAAKVACEGVRDFLEKEAGDLEATLPFILKSYFSLPANVLFNALIHSNRSVNVLNHHKGVHEKGGASVLAALIDGDLLALANVGACSAWLLRAGKSVPLLFPRTYGRLWNPFLEEYPDEMCIPLMAVGMAEDLEPEIAEYRIQAGDWILLQTDGLGDAERRAVVNIREKALSPSQAAQTVHEYMKSRCFSDNAALSLVIL